MEPKGNDMADELLPCPKCGEPGRVYHDTHSDYESQWSFRPMCNDGDCIEGPHFDTVAKAVAWWNARLSRPVAWRAVAWLIERKNWSTDDTRLRWYAENEDDGWHYWIQDASYAKRFSSKEEALAFPPYQMIASDPDISVTEHVFLSPGHPSPQGGTEPDGAETPDA